MKPQVRTSHPISPPGHINALLTEWADFPTHFPESYKEGINSILIPMVLECVVYQAHNGVYSKSVRKPFKIKHSYKPRGKGERGKIIVMINNHVFRLLFKARKVNLTKRTIKTGNV